MDIFVIEIVNADNVHMELLKQFQKKEISNPKKWNEHCFSYLMVDRILRDFYGIEDRNIVFNGKKPFLKNRKKFFSVSHSNDFIALAFSDYDCGVDIEKIKDTSNKEQRIKRKQFYLKNDFKETDVFYAWQGEDYVILSRNGIVQKKEFWNFWDFLKKEKK